MDVWSRAVLLMVQKSGEPVEICSLSHDLQGFYTSHVVGKRIYEPSTVCHACVLKVSAVRRIKASDVQ